MRLLTRPGQRKPVLFPQTRSSLTACLTSHSQLMRYSAITAVLRQWRLVHMSLLLLLFISGTFHVLAVHMY